MTNPLQGLNPISRGDLHDMVRESFSWERNFRERKRKACYEFYDRTAKVTDTKLKVKIMKEVAAKYDFREEWFMEQVRL